MKFRTRLIITGVCAYLLFVIATVPASLIFKFTHNQLQSAAVSGTIWRGKASTLQAGILNIGDVEWNLHVLPLFVGHIAADMKLVQQKGFAQGKVIVSAGGKIRFSNLKASLPLDTILGQGGLPGGWTGTANINFDELI